MAFFDVDFDSVVWCNIPVMLRDVVMYSWLRVLVAPVKYIYGLFSANRTANLYQLAHNGQVCYLTAALNDTFDPALRRIYIDDDQVPLPVYVYLADEEKPVWLGRVSEEGSTAYPDPAWLYTVAETADPSFDFIVYVPAAVTLLTGYNLAYLTALVNKYRLAGMRFEVVVV